MSESALFGVTLPPRRGFSVPIQLVQGAGVSAWLVEDHSLPVVSLAWAWPGGGGLDPEGRAGLAGMAAALLAEGAGELGHVAFQDAMRDAGIGLGFSAGRDGFEGGVRALSEALPEAIRLARLAMTAPRLEPAALERVRARAVLGARQQEETPGGKARRAFWESAFPGHPAGRLATPETLAAITADDIRAALGRQLRRQGVLVAAAGAIDAAGLSAAMAALFEGLPAEAPPALAPLPPMAAFGVVARPLALPQSSLVFGQDALPPDDPAWEAQQMAVRILAGGGFSSRLMRTVREERGLTYGIGAGLDVIQRRALLLGSVATENAQVGEVWRLVRDAWAAMAAEGPTAEEVADAAAFLAGSLPLQFTDTRRTASLLLALRQAGRTPDWLAGRPQRLAALTRAQVAEAAARALRPQALALAVAGEPRGL